jgi:O-antigen/teichoic acid export membrane protein
LIGAANVLTASIVTIAMAAAGFSTISFAWAWLASTAVTAALAFFAHPDLSIFRPTGKGWRAMISFGWYSGANQVLRRVFETVPGILLGRFVSANAVGLFNRGMNICLLPDKAILSGVAAVAVPAFSAKSRENVSLREPYLRAVSYVTALQWPALVVVAILAHPIVQVLLGAQWSGTVPIIQILALALLFSFTSELNFPVLVAVGAMRDLFIRALIMWPASMAIISIGAFFGLKAIAFSYFLAVPLQAVVAFQAVRKHTPITWSDIGTAVMPSLLVTLMAATGPLAMVALKGFRFDLSVTEGIVAGLLSAPCWLFGLWLTKHPLLEEVGHVTSALQKSGLGRRFSSKGAT